MSKSELNKSERSENTSATKIVILKYGNPSNWTQFKENFIPYAEKQYGNVAVRLSTGKEFEFDEPTFPEEIISSSNSSDSEDETRSVGNRSAGESTIERLLAKEKLREYRKQKDLILAEKMSMRLQQPKLYAAIWERLSPESKEKVRDSEGFDTEIERKKDPFKLWERLELTHSLGDSLVKSFNVVRANIAYWTAVQRAGESVHEYRRRVMDLGKRLTALGEKMPETEIQVAHFILSLEKSKYGQYVVDTENRVASKVEELPSTLTDAQIAAANYKVVHTAQPKESKATVFAVNGEKAKKGNFNKRAHGDSKEQKTEPKQESKASTATSEPAESAPKKEKKEYPCGFCNKTGHYLSKCPVKEELLQIKDTLKPTKKASVNITVAADGDSTAAAPQVEQGAIYALEGVSRGEVSPDWVLFDSLATHSIFCNADLVENIRPGSPREFSGFGGGALVADQVATLPGFGTVYFHPQCGVNIISVTTCNDRAIRFAWNQSERTFVVTFKNGVDHYFGPVNRLFACKFTPLRKASVHVVTVADNKRAYTDRQIKEADAAFTFMKRLGFPSVENAVRAANTSINCPVTAEHIRRAYDIYGKNVSVIKGKSVSRKPSKIRIERLPTSLNIERRQTLSVDLMFVAGIAFLLSISNPLGLAMTTVLGKGKGHRTKEAIRGPLMQHIAAYKAKNFAADYLCVDREGPIMALEQELNEAGVTLNESGAGSHVPHVERKIREIKDHCRCIKDDVPFVLSEVFIVYLVYFAVSRINLVRHKGDVYSEVSPRELFTGRKLNFDLDIRVAFGDYCMVQNPAINNTLEPRSQGAIALMPTGNWQGSVKFFLLDSHKIVVRDNFEVLPMPDEVVRYLNMFGGAATNASGPAQQLSFSYADTTINDDQYADVDNGEPLLVPNPAAPTVVAIEELPDDVDTDQRGETDDNYWTVPMVEAATGDDPMIMDDEDPVQGVPDDADAMPEVDLAGPLLQDAESIGPDGDEHVEEYNLAIDTGEDAVESGYGLRSRARERQYLHPTKQTVITKDEYESLTKGKGMILNTLSVKQAFKKHPKAAEEALMKELNQMITQLVFTPVHQSELTKYKLVPFWSFVFYKEKFTPAGAFERLKARLVADGSQQDRSIYAPDPMDVYAPTVSMSALFTMLGIFAKEGLKLWTGDVPGAFLHSELDADPGVKATSHVMVLDRMTTKHLLILEPKYQEFVRKDGTMLVKLNKALYGIIEAPRRWHETATDKLIRIGFKPSSIEPCLYVYRRGDVVCFAVRYVDDVFYATNSEEFSEYLQFELENDFPGIKWKGGLEHEFVGMEMAFLSDRSVVIKMTGYINDLIESTNTIGFADSPAGDHLFTVKSEEEAEYLDKASAKAFHTTAAKCLYLGKRIRPDILTTVSFLCTRVLKPDQDDYAKLMRLLKYINKTRDESLRIKVTEDMQITAYIDASYAVHPDMKSHGGLCITLGEGSVLSKSYKIRMNTKSSTEAELIAASDNLGEAMWLRELLESIGYNPPPVRFLEDNMSTIRLIKNGRPESDASRHISIRYFWINWVYETKQAILQHCPTVDMFADLLTKPLHGDMMKRLRDKLLGVAE